MASQVPHFAERISKIAQHRSRVWTWIGKIWTGDEALIDELRSGQFAENMREHFSLIGQEPIALGPLMSLDVYSRGVRRRTRDADVAAFRTDLESFASRAPLEEIATMSDLCRAESVAWAAGDLDGGRGARRAEFEHLEAGLEKTLSLLCQDVADHASTHVWRTLGRLMQVFLATETGHQSMLTSAGNLDR